MLRDAEKLRMVIEASRLSARVFARTVLLRDERTVRRWLAGDSPIPEPVSAKLDEWLLEYGIIHHRTYRKANARKD